MESKDDFRVIPKRKLSEAEKQIITLRIEKMKLEREKTLLILGSAVILFFAFIILAVLGLLNEFITSNQLNVLIVIGLAALIIGIVPYIRFVLREQSNLEKTLDELMS